MDATLNMNQAYNPSPEEMEREKAIKEKVSKNLLWFGIIGIVMMFSGLTSAVIVSKGGNFWININMPMAFWISTGLILLSSLTINMARTSILKNNKSATKFLVLITLLLGIAFSISQFMGYKQLFDGGHAFTSRIFDDQGNPIPKGQYGKDYSISYKGEILKMEEGIFFKSTGPLSDTERLKLINTRNTSSSYLYMLTFLHFLHMAGGLIYLIVVSVMAFREKFDSSNCLKIKLSGIYWHFLGILWIYLFVFFQFIH